MGALKGEIEHLGLGPWSRKTFYKRLFFFVSATATLKLSYKSVFVKDISRSNVYWKFEVNINRIKKLAES